jgi:hypothetical protein
MAKGLRNISALIGLTSELVVIWFPIVLMVINFYLPALQVPVALIPKFPWLAPVADAAQAGLWKWIAIEGLMAGIWLGVQFFHLNSEKTPVDSLKRVCKISVFTSLVILGGAVGMGAMGMLTYGYLVPLGASVIAAAFSPGAALSTLARRFTPPISAH